MSGGNSAQMSGGDSAKMSGGDFAKMSGGDFAKMSGGDSAQMVAGYESSLNSGKHSVVVGDNGSKAKAELGTILVLVNREYKNNDLIIVDYKAGLVDGKKIKADTWYKLKNGKFIEVTI
jgi:hypothetical protein